jgi:hypothetical protein
LLKIVEIAKFAYKKILFENIIKFIQIVALIIHSIDCKTAISADEIVASTTTASKYFKGNLNRLQIIYI